MKMRCAVDNFCKDGLSIIAKYVYEANVNQTCI